MGDADSALAVLQRAGVWKFLHLGQENHTNQKMANQKKLEEDMEEIRKSLSSLVIH